MAPYFGRKLKQNSKSNQINKSIKRKLKSKQIVESQKYNLRKKTNQIDYRESENEPEAEEESSMIKDFKETIGDESEDICKKIPKLKKYLLKMQN